MIKFKVSRKNWNFGKFPPISMSLTATIFLLQLVVTLTDVKIHSKTRQRSEDLRTSAKQYLPNDFATSCMDERSLRSSVWTSGF